MVALGLRVVEGAAIPPGAAARGADNGFVSEIRFAVSSHRPGPNQRGPGHFFDLGVWIATRYTSPMTTNRLPEDQRAMRKILRIALEDRTRRISSFAARLRSACQRSYLDLTAGFVSNGRDRFGAEISKTTLGSTRVQRFCDW